MSRFLKSSFQGIEPYTPGEQPKNSKLIKLNTNESPYPPSPMVIEAIHTEELENLKLYSDPEAKVLVEAAAEYYNVDEDQIMAGNGSDELLAFSFMAYGEKIYFPNVSYGFYKVYGRIFGEKVTMIPLDKGLKIKVKDYYNLDGTVIIANPNAPTGIALTKDEIEQIISCNKNNLVIIDEAYVDFGAESVVCLLGQYDNLLVIQTLSKSRSLAGARIGVAIGNKEVIRDLKNIKYSFNPYNLNRLSMVAGAAAFKDKDYFEKCCDKIKDTRDRLVKDLEFAGFEVLPSKANFIFAKPPGISGEEYFQQLRKNNILVRHFNEPLIKDYVRITIGTDEEMNAIREQLSVL
ncbi:MAG: histidinol-phosphate transaminase [Peptostreptococcaceae bacterium]|nr:histidinol-phosphate transaminase [Peptostreptococcaceae bacterium]